MNQVTNSLESPAGSSQRLLVLIGVLWLLLAATIIITQISTSPPIRIEWETETEINTAGFNIYRSNDPAGEFIQLNQELIPAEGSPVSGASYSFVDHGVAGGQTYFYKLEDIELDNSRTQHDLIEYQAPLTAWWVPLTAAFSVLCGLFLLIKGLRQEKKR